MHFNIQNDCYEGLSDSCRVHQIRVRPGLRPGPRWVSSRRSPRPPSRLGRGTPPPHSPPPRRIRRLGPRRLRRLVPKTPSEFFFRDTALDYVVDLRLHGVNILVYYILYGPDWCVCHTRTVSPFNLLRVRSLLGKQESSVRVLVNTCVECCVCWFSVSESSVSMYKWTMHLQRVDVRRSRWLSTWRRWTALSLQWDFYCPQIRNECWLCITITFSRMSVLGLNCAWCPIFHLSQRLSWLTPVVVKRIFFVAWHRYSHVLVSFMSSLNMYRYSCPSYKHGTCLQQKLSPDIINQSLAEIYVFVAALTTIWPRVVPNKQNVCQFY